MIQKVDAENNYKDNTSIEKGTSVLDNFNKEINKPIKEVFMHSKNADVSVIRKKHNLKNQISQVNTNQKIKKITFLSNQQRKISDLTNIESLGKSNPSSNI